MGELLQIGGFTSKPDELINDLNSRTKDISFKDKMRLYRAFTFEKFYDVAPLCIGVIKCIIIASQV